MKPPGFISQYFSNYKLEFIYSNICKNKWDNMTYTFTYIKYFFTKKTLNLVEKNSKVKLSVFLFRRNDNCCLGTIKSLSNNVNSFAFMDTCKI